MDVDFCNEPIEELTFLSDVEPHKIVHKSTIYKSPEKRSRNKNKRQE